MFDIAMLLAAGLLGIQAKRAKKEEMQAASERLIMQHKQQQQTLEGAMLNLAEESTLKHLLKSFQQVHNTPSLSKGFLYELFDKEQTINYRGKSYSDIYHTTPDQLLTVAPRIAGRVDMTLDQFLVWSANVFFPWDKDGSGAHYLDRDDKYYANGDISGITRKHFDMKRQVLVELLPTPAIIESGKKWPFGKGRTQFLENDCKILQCDAEMKKFIADHPRDPWLTKLFGTEEWRYYI